MSNLKDLQNIKDNINWNYIINKYITSLLRIDVTNRREEDIEKEEG